MFYRLLCLQNYEYMGTGYNTKSKEELCADYISYKSVDFDEENDEAWYKALSTDEVIKLIEQDEFRIETSETEFSELELI